MTLQPTRIIGTGCTLERGTRWVLPVRALSGEQTMQRRIPRIGLVALTDPRETGRSDACERYISRQHNALAEFLRNSGMAVVDPMPELRKAWTDTYGINRMREIEACVNYFATNLIECLVVECYHWSDPALVAALARRTGVPLALYTDGDASWDGTGFVVAVSAVLREGTDLTPATTHCRLRGAKEEILAWARGVTAYTALRRAHLLLWGSERRLHCDPAREDEVTLKDRLFGECLHEDQLVLTQAAEALLAREPKRIESMVTWLKKQGVNIRYDTAMLTPQTLARQVALYLAARDRLAQLEQAEGVVGCSIKCQCEISEVWGVTACLLPTFLPFPRDAYGPKSDITTVCKGDLRGLVTSLLLRQLSNEHPVLFGAVRGMTESYVLIGNCGGASAYYGANSIDLAKAMPRLALRPQCLGRGGAAVELSGRPGPMTFARLARVRGRYVMQLGLGECQSVRKEVRERLRFGTDWPLHVVKFPSDSKLLFDVLAGDHLSGVPGDVTAEVTHACREAGLAVVRLDRDDSLRQAQEALFGGF